MTKKPKSEMAVVLGMVLLTFLITMLIWAVQGVVDGIGKVFMAMFGSSLYVLSKRDIPNFNKWVFFTVGMIAGIKGADFISTVCDALLLSSGIEAHLPHDISALALSALVVFILASFYDIKIKDILERIFP